MKIDCDREQDVLDALAAQRWPVRCDDELKAHVHACAVCADLVTVVGALLDDQDVAYEDARVPPSGVVWWRAQLRAREEDARAAARPIAFIQGVAASAAVWVIVTIVRSLPAAMLQAWKDSALGLLAYATLPALNIGQLAAGLPLSVVIAVGAGLLLLPLAIYFAVAED